MAIKFAQHAAGSTNLKPLDGHVMGWMLPDFVSEREYLYAVCTDGRILRADAPLGTPAFDNHQRTWHAVKVVPGGAEWIGHYPVPKRIAA